MERDGKVFQGLQHQELFLRLVIAPWRKALCCTNLFFPLLFFLPPRLFQELISDAFSGVPAWKTCASKAMDKRAPNPAQIGLAFLILLSEYN